MNNSNKTYTNFIKYNNKIALLFLPIFVVFLAVILIFAFVLNGSAIEHIEDTNGADNYSLTTITDEDIIKNEMGSRGGVNTTTSKFLGEDIEFSSDKFTGVCEVLYCNYALPSDFVLDLTGFQVDSGNFKMSVVNNGKIIKTIEPNDTIHCLIEGVTGKVSLMVAGESANFTFYMTKSDFNEFEHLDITEI